MILGLVQWMQPVHGYDVRRELLSWSADKWANVAARLDLPRAAQARRGGAAAGGGDRAGGRPAGPHHVRDDATRASASSRRCCAATGGADERRRTRSWRRSRSCRRCRARRRRRRCATGPACCAPASSSCASALERGLGTDAQAGPRGLDVRAVDRRGRRRRSPGASGSRSGSSPACRTCPERMARAVAGDGRVSRRTSTRITTRNNQG